MSKKRPNQDDLTEADRVLLDLYDRSREPIAWDESDDAILTAARAAQPGSAATDDLDQADKVLLELYARGKEPIAWDESDDAILAAARKSVTANDDGPVTTAPSAPEEDLGENVVRFPANRVFRRVFATPAAGWAIAASIIVGIFVGQGTTPYINLGVGPDVRGLLDENARLTQKVDDAQGEIMRLSQEFTDTGIRFTEEGEQPGPTPETGPVAAAVPGLTELGRVLDQFECAALSATIRQGSNLLIEGHVASADDMNRLLAALEPYAGVARVANQAQVYAWPHCEAVEILDELTLANAPTAGSPSVRPFQHGLTYQEGEPVVIEAVAGAGAGYLYVDFLQNDGTVVHLLSGTRVNPGDQIRLGESGLTFSVAPPFGTEMLLIVQSAQPLFASDRPQVDEAAAYLPALRGALQSGGQAALSGFTFVTTGP